MTYIQPNANGQATSANSSPVVIANDQSAVPVSGTVTANIGTVATLATTAKQDTGNTSVASIDTKTPALGQALAAASVPVILPSATITTLTPPAAIAGFATSAKQDTLLTELQLKADLTETQPVSLASVPSHPVTNAGTFAVQASAGTNLNTSALALDATLGTTNTEIGGLTETAPATDTASSGLNGRLQRISQRLTTLIGSTIAVSGTFWQATQPVSGTFWQATQPVSGTVTTSPPSNASTNVAQLAGTTTDTNSGVKSAGTLRVVLATDQPALTNKLLVTPDSVALPANQSVNVAQVGGTNMVNGGVAGSQSIGGTVATNVAITDNPINNGAQAVSSENAAVTTARKVQLVADLVGKLIVLPYANPENFVSGAITTAMTGTTTTSLVAAPAAGLRNYITQITVSNSHATVGTDVIIQDGSGGTTLYTIPAAAVYGGAVITFPTPLRQPTTATAIFCANVTTGASTKVSASGYKGA